MMLILQNTISIQKTFREASSLKIKVIKYTALLDTTPCKSANQGKGLANQSDLQ